MKHLLVTNDYPPKIGGIQSYLWELWRRLPPSDVTVLTTPYEGDAEFDAQQAYEVVRTKQRWLLPTPGLIRQINHLAERVEAELVVLDPALPLGLVGPHLRRPYVVIGHGAELVIPSKIPFSRSALDRVLKSSVGAVASGDYVREVLLSMATMAGKPTVSIPPGVDVERFAPITQERRSEVRKKYGLEDGARLVVGVSRLVPRKGFDRLIRAAAALRSDHPELAVLIAGTGREQRRLAKLVTKSGAPVTLLGRVPDADLPDLYGAADVFCMPCHDRWFGLEREGFGIVFVEAAAAGLPSVAGLSGGSGEAVLHRETGLVVSGRVKPAEVASGIRELITDEPLREQLAAAGRDRAVEVFSYDVLADQLGRFLTDVMQPPTK